MNLGNYIVQKFSQLRLCTQTITQVIVGKIVSCKWNGSTYNSLRIKKTIIPRFVCKYEDREKSKTQTRFTEQGGKIFGS